MNYIGNKQYWDEKFMNRCGIPLEPEKSLVENIEHFNRGSVLDIGCGDGRNSLFLVKNNFKVTGIDFSREALKRLELFTENRNYTITTKEVDLNNPDSLNGLGVFDNILINHYKLNEEQLSNLKNHIIENGILFICGFGHKHKIDFKIKKGDLIYPSDFENISREFELIKYMETDDNRGFFVTYIFKKR